MQSLYKNNIVCNVPIRQKCLSVRQEVRDRPRAMDGARGIIGTMDGARDRPRAMDRP